MKLSSNHPYSGIGKYLVVAFPTESNIVSLTGVTEYDRYLLWFTLSPIQASTEHNPYYKIQCSLSNSETAPRFPRLKPGVILFSLNRKSQSKSTELMKYILLFIVHS